MTPVPPSPRPGGGGTPFRVWPDLILEHLPGPLFGGSSAGGQKRRARHAQLAQLDFLRDTGRRRRFLWRIQAPLRVFTTAVCDRPRAHGAREVPFPSAEPHGHPPHAARRGRRSTHQCAHSCTRTSLLVWGSEDPAKMDISRMALLSRDCARSAGAATRRADRVCRA